MVIHCLNDYKLYAFHILVVLLDNPNLPLLVRNVYVKSFRSSESKALPDFLENYSLPEVFEETLVQP